MRQDQKKKKTKLCGIEKKGSRQKKTKHIRHVCAWHLMMMTVITSHVTNTPREHDCLNLLTGFTGLEVNIS